MRRTNPFAAAVLGAVVALAFIAMPGVSFGETSTSHGSSPSDVYTTTDSGICADVDTFGEAPILPTHVSVAAASNLLVSFTSEISGLQADTELLLSLTVTDNAGNFVAGMGEWGVSNDPRLHDSKTVMWPFDDFAPGDYDVFVDARTDPVPGPAGGGHTHNNPAAALEHCALSVIVVPAA